MTRKRTPKQTHIGPLGPGSKNVPHYIPERTVFETPSRVTNFTSKAPLSLDHEWRNSAQRPGCMDAFAFSSKGLRC